MVGRPKIPFVPWRNGYFDRDLLKMTKEVDSTVFRSTTRLDDSFLIALEHALKEVWLYRWQIAVTFRRDFRLASQMSGLGTLWNYVLPLVPLSVYIALMAVRVLPAFDGVNGLLYVAIGVTLWLFFSGIVLRPITVLESRFRELSRTQMPMLAALLSSFAYLIFEMTVRFAFVAILFGFFQGLPKSTAVLLPVILFAGFLFFFPVGLILALWNLAYSDIGKLTRIFLQYGIFLSGVIFPIASLPVVGPVAFLNPFYVFIEASRSALALGTVHCWPSMVGFSAVGLLLSGLAIKVFYVLEVRLRGLV